MDILQIGVMIKVPGVSKEGFIMYIINIWAEMDTLITFWWNRYYEFFNFFWIITNEASKDGYFKMPNGVIYILMNS